MSSEAQINKWTFIKNLTFKKVHRHNIKDENETTSISFQIDLLMKCRYFKWLLHVVQVAVKII